MAPQTKHDTHTALERWAILHLRLLGCSRVNCVPNTFQPSIILYPSTGWHRRWMAPVAEWHRQHLRGSLLGCNVLGTPFTRECLHVGIFSARELQPSVRRVCPVVTVALKRGGLPWGAQRNASSASGTIPNESRPRGGFSLADILVLKSRDSSTGWHRRWK